MQRPPPFKRHYLWERGIHSVHDQIASSSRKDQEEHACTVLCAEQLGACSSETLLQVPSPLLLCLRLWNVVKVRIVAPRSSLASLGAIQLHYKACKVIL